MPDSTWERGLRAFVCGLLLLSSGCLQKSPQGLDKDAIRASFSKYFAAIAEGDAAAATALLSERTISHYSRLRDAALASSREDLARLPLAIRYEVLLLRDRIDADVLRSMNGRDLAEAYTAQNWINSAMLSRISLGNIIHKGDAAEAVMADEGVPTKDRLIFYREDGTWKFDLAATYKMQSRLLTRKMEEERLSEEEVLEATLAPLVSRNVKQLWTPLNERTDGPARVPETASARSEQE